MQSTKPKVINQAFHRRKFRMIVEEDPEIVYTFDGEPIVFCGMSEASCSYEVYIPNPLFEKRGELFQAGHRLWLLAETDDTALLNAVDAWFDRGEDI